MGMKYLRIELESCSNRTDPFEDPILVQYSLNNGLLWNVLTRMIYRPNKPWLIALPMDEAMQMHLVRLRFFQRVNTSKISLAFTRKREKRTRSNVLEWTSSWILHRLEVIPEKLPEQWTDTNSTIVSRCHSR